MLSLSAQNSKHERSTPKQFSLARLAILLRRNTSDGGSQKAKAGRLWPFTFLLVLFLPYALYLMPCASIAYAAATVTVAWDSNAETDVIGYKFHYGTVSKNYQHTVDVQNNTSCSISGLTEGTTYYFAATAYNDKNIESSYSEELVYTIPMSNSLAFEIGDIELRQNWVRVNFTESFVDPIVVAKPISLNGAAPALIRIRNIDAGGFDIRIQEWEYQDGIHAKETVSYLVMENGNFTLADGTQIEAGRFATNKTGRFGTFSFYQSFQDTPVVLASISSFNEADAVTGRLRNLSNQGFEFSMQEQELNPKEHLTETVDYIAWQSSMGSLNGYTFEVSKTADTVTAGFYGIEFEQTYGSAPHFLADMQTTDGWDTANVRWQNKNNYSVEVQIDEETSMDTETAHAAEVVGYMVFGY